MGQCRILRPVSYFSVSYYSENFSYLNTKLQFFVFVLVQVLKKACFDISDNNLLKVSQLTQWVLMSILRIVYNLHL